MSVDVEPATEFWLLAELDLDAVDTLLRADVATPALFHLQQAIEKRLNAVIVARGGDVKRTHDLTALANTTDLPSEFAGHIEGLLGIISDEGMGVRYGLAMARGITREHVESLVERSAPVLEWLEAAYAASIA